MFPNKFFKRPPYYPAPQQFYPNPYHPAFQPYAPMPALRKVIEDYSYGLNDIIGQGLTSLVFLGRNDVIDLKAIQTQEAKQMLLNEIELLKQLKHPNVLNCIDIYTTANNCYIITEYCQEGDLQKCFKLKGLFKEDAAIKIMVDVLEACKFLAENKVIHRDLKSSNILLTKGIAKLADFGFAIKQQKLQQKQLYNVGSPMYMSPQTLINNVYNLKTDIFSLGIIFYQLIFGVAPWQSKNEAQLIDKIITKEVDFNINKNISLSELTKEFIVKALKINPEDRLDPKDFPRFIEEFRSMIDQSKEVKQEPDSKQTKALQ